MQYIPLIRNWLDCCSTDHRTCNSHDETAWLPTRLIDVGVEVEGIAEEPRLVSTPYQRHETSYVTLSHRWVKGEMPRLTTKNIENFKVRLDLHDMPQIFLDAISVTRELGIKYLWIDCLCILQDRPEDWERESAVMGKVYEHGICNLAATGASSGGKGKGLREQLNEATEPINFCKRKIECNWNSHDPQQSRIHYLIRGEIWVLGVERAPLNGRGWVVQERFLSPRTIHFGLDRLFWECRQLSACSATLDGSMSEIRLPQHMLTSLNLKRWREATTQAKSKDSLGLGTLHELYGAWDAVKSAYTRTSVTCEKDRLVALSGLSASFQDILQDQYLAGLWRRTLIYDLLWSIPEPKRRTSSRAPSWSWASMEDGIDLRSLLLPQYPNGNHELAKIVDVRVESSGRNPTGQVRSGHLQIRGALLPLECVRHRASPTPQISSLFSMAHLGKNSTGQVSSETKQVGSGHLQPRGIMLPIGCTCGHRTPPTEQTSSRFSMSHPTLRGHSVTLDEMTTDAQMRNLFCLHLLLSNYIEGDGIFHLHGLVLRPTKQRQDEFTRAGIFHCEVEPRDYYLLLNQICLVQGEANQHRIITIT